MSDTVKIKNIEILSDHKYFLEKISYDIRDRNGIWKTVHREVYKRKNSAAILLYNPSTHSVALTRQFRLPTYLNGNPEGFFIEACAGIIENDETPEECIRREAEEETGYKIQELQKAFDSYMSPGSLTEIVHCFVSDYSKAEKISEGGGLEAENEDIEVIEIHFEQALGMIRTGEIGDAKTIMLLQYALINRLMF